MSHDDAPADVPQLSWLQFFDSPTDALLVRSTKEVVELVLAPSGRALDAKQLSVLRKHFQRLRALPLAQLRATVETSSPMSLGWFDRVHAEPVFHELEQATVPVAANPQVNESYTAFDQKLGMPIFMLSHQVNAAMIAMMIEAGVPIVDGDTSKPPE